MRKVIAFIGIVSLLLISLVACTKETEYAEDTQSYCNQLDTCEGYEYWDDNWEERNVESKEIIMQNGSHKHYLITMRYHK